MLAARLLLGTGARQILAAAAATAATPADLQPQQQQQPRPPTRHHPTVPTANMAGRFRLDGRAALVTGGTKGIGRAVAGELAGLGAQVFVCARTAADVAATVAELRAEGHSAQGCAADLSDAAQRQQLLQQVTEAFGGRLHILVCNAGTNTQLPTLQYTQQHYDAIVGTNLAATFALCQLMQPLLAAGAAAAPAQQGAAAGGGAAAAGAAVAGASAADAAVLGSANAAPAAAAAVPAPPDISSSSGGGAGGDACIVLISSVAGGPLAGRSGSLYAASKAALNQLAASLACEWAAARIRVNSVAPWVTLTELGKQNLTDAALVERLLARTPLKRLAQPEDISGLVAFLASPAATYITGQTIAVDGGYSVMGMW